MDCAVALIPLSKDRIFFNDAQVHHRTALDFGGFHCMLKQFAADSTVTVFRKNGKTSQFT
jgi:hypothetical protein